MVNSPLIRPYLLGGSFGGGTLDCHDVARSMNFGEVPSGRVFSRTLRPQQIHPFLVLPKLDAMTFG